MPAELTYTIPFPLPPHLSPSTLLTALHTLTPIITANPHCTSYAWRPLPVSEIVNDTFFPHDAPNARLAAYDVTQEIPMLGLSKTMTVPCVMQSFEGGVRCRSIAAGVTVWSTWRIRRREAKEYWGGELGEATAGEWEVVEEARVQCGSLVKPFVSRSFVGAHREILKRLVDGVLEGEMRRGDRFA